MNRMTFRNTGPTVGYIVLQVRINKIKQDRIAYNKHHTKNEVISSRLCSNHTEMKRIYLHSMNPKQVNTLDIEQVTKTSQSYSSSWCNTTD
jgi:hypothetical protein